MGGGGWGTRATAAGGAGTDARTGGRQLSAAGWGHYSPGFLSRLERGWASPPLWVYVVLAEHFDVEPGRLLGPDHVATVISEAEVTLLRLLRRLRVEPDEAIARLVRVDGGSAGDCVAAP
jgi:hypothetical protein